VVPARRTWFTRLGAATMYVYLLHGFVTLFLSYQDWYYELSGAEVAAVTVGCVALAVLLSTGAVRRVFGWAVEPRLGWLFRDDGGPDAPAERSAHDRGVLADG
jgi:fucose 4-O-acetylase-like acetyltransferase